MITKNILKSSAAQKIVSILSDRKALLQIALASLIETIRSQPDKYGKLHIMSSRPIGVSHNQNYTPSSINGQSHVFQDHYIHAYNTIVIGEAEKLYYKSVKGLVVEIMGRITSTNGRSSTPSLVRNKIKDPLK